LTPLGFAEGSDQPQIDSPSPLLSFNSLPTPIYSLPIL
jgi:hypothetical protein